MRLCKALTNRFRTARLLRLVRSFKTARKVTKFFLNLQEKTQKKIICHHIGNLIGNTYIQHRNHENGIH